MSKIKKDIILILGILLTAGALWLVPFLRNKDTSGSVQVSINGRKIAVYPLTEEGSFPISNEEGGYNLLLISGGTASVSDADCPDGLCVKARSISKAGESIICLPHKLVIQIEKGKESGPDAVTY